MQRAMQRATEDEEEQVEAQAVVDDDDSDLDAFAFDEGVAEEPNADVEEDVDEKPAKKRKSSKKDNADKKTRKKGVVRLPGHVSCMPLLRCYCRVCCHTAAELRPILLPTMLPRDAVALLLPCCCFELQVVRTCLILGSQQQSGDAKHHTHGPLIGLQSPHSPFAAGIAHRPTPPHSFPGLGGLTPHLTHCASRSLHS